MFGEELLKHGRYPWVMRIFFPSNRSLFHCFYLNFVRKISFLTKLVILISQVAVT